MAITQFTNLPTISDKSSFSSRWENLVNVQLPRFVNETNTDIALLNNNSTTGTSTTSLTVGTGSISLTASTGKSWTINSSVRIYSTASAGIWMDGYVTAYNSSTGALTVLVTNRSGSGTLASWGIILVPSQIGSDISISGTGGRITGDFTNANYANRVLFQSNVTNGATALSVIPNGTNVTSGFTCVNSTNNTNYSIGTINVNATEFSVTATRAGTGAYLPINFYTSDIARISILTGGTTQFIRDNPGDYVSSHVEMRSGAGNVNLSFHAVGSTASVLRHLRGGNGLQIVGITNALAPLDCSAVTNSSDYRLKENLKPLENSGKFIDGLKPKTWQWKADGSQGIGFVAHEAGKVAKLSVFGEKDAVDENGEIIHQSFAYGSGEMIANIVAELQSLRKRVKDLENK